MKDNLEAIYPLSPMQQGLLFHTVYAPEAGMYIGQMTCRLEGNLNVQALEDAWQRLLSRHSALRTAFVWKRVEEPRQVVHERVSLKLERLDCRRLSAEEQAAKLQAYLYSDRVRGFDLTKAPLTRIALIQIREDAYYFVWTQHHLVIDGWCLHLLLKEGFTFYQALCQGQEVTLEPARPYRDYILWLQKQKLSEAEAFWRRTLKDFTAPTPFSVDRHPDDSFAAKPDTRDRYLELPAETASALHALARENQVTLNTLVQGVWALLLSRYSRENDVTFGVVVSGRPPDLAGAESMIGLFVNSLPLRVQVRPEFELLPWLRALQQQQADMRQFEYSPLVDVHAWSEVPRSAPLFESILAYQNYPALDSVNLSLLNLEISDVQVSDQTSFPLVLQAVASGQGLSFRFSYDGNRFEDCAIHRLMGHWQTLLESVARQPQRKLRDFPLLTPAEHESAVVLANEPQRAAPQFQCLQSRFEKQAEIRPDGVAVTCEDRQITYGELNRKANQLAHHLRSRGVGREVAVGLCTERSIPMIIGLLGILKAGGTYVPLDPDYPQARLEFMLEDSRTSLLLTQESLLSKLPEKKPAVLCLDSDWERIAEEPGHNPVNTASPDNAAYVIYTSGSTGRPKGTVVSHANVGRLFDASEEWFHFGPGDVWTMFHSLAFDFSVWEIWGPLLFGGRLVVVPYFVSRSPEAFYEVLLAQQVTVLNQTPSAFRQIIRHEETLEETAPLALRLVIFGGEALEMRSLAPWFERHGDQRPQLVNMYGITETTVHVTYRPLTRADAGESELELSLSRIPRGSVIGRPIPDLQIYLLDGQLQPVPVGIPGELHVGGAGLSRGYLGRPELTAERFIPDPFSPSSGSRLYKSGDLARRLADGDIEYMGRIDQQVKVRGFRIEPAEIESVLASHPAVREAVVLQRGDSPGGGALAGYVVARESYFAAQEASASEEDRIAQWQAVYEETYRQDAPTADPAFNISGWNSSYTGLPIPAEEMREWVEQTVAQIRQLPAERVLEIGCGTGLLLLRLAPHAKQYWGTDFSQVGLDYIARQAANLGLPEITLLRRMADNFEGIEENFFDTVILNSVVQYFPNMEYLMRVLEGAVRSTRPGGTVFLGDIRNLPLLEKFHVAVQLEQATASRRREHLLEFVRRRVAQEEELVIDPGFFRVLSRHMPKIAHAEVRLKRGRSANELTQFRYDVVLHVGSDVSSEPEPAPVSLDWRKEKLTLPGLRQLLSLKDAPAIEVRGVPNGRVSFAVRASRLLEDANGPETAGAIRQALRESDPSGIDLEAVASIAGECGYDASFTWSAGGADGDFDVLLLRDAGRARSQIAPAAGLKDQEEVRPWSQYANNPLRGILSQRLIPELRRFLRAQVPEYMVPSAFVMLESMPLTHNGKVDRAALPEPSGERPKVDAPFVPPVTETEKELARIWVDVLGVDRIGIHDNFFDLGGHSLMVIQLMSRVRKSFQVELPLRDVFAAPTIKEIGEMLEARILAKASDEKIDQLLSQLEGIDEKKALQMLDQRKF